MLEIHFLNVGHGDCTIIRHPSGRITMVDINNGDEIDNDSFDEILSEPRLSTQTLASLLAGLGTPTYPTASLSSLSGSGGMGGLFDVPALGLAPGLFGSVAPQTSLAALLAPRPDKKRQLSDVGYDIALTDPVSYYLRHFGTRPIFRYVQTHPDLDHMRGLSSLRKAGIGIINLWDTNHDKRPDLINSSDREDWNEYSCLRSGRLGAVCGKRFAGERGQFWNHDPYGLDNHDGIEILSPTPLLTFKSDLQEDYNKLSYVLRISYANRRIILGGDADEEAWQSITDRHWRDLRCDVLKASHHGRDSGYELSALRLMRPTYTIVSVGKKPEADASNKYRQYSERVWSTRWYGNLCLRVHPNGNIKWTGQYVDRSK